MKQIYTILTFLILIMGSFNCWAKLNVVATTSDLGYFAQQIGGNLVEVKTLARGDQDVHFLEPKPSYIALANQADVLIHNGLELEIGWLPVLMNQAKNPKIQPNQPGNLNASEHVPVIELPNGNIDRSMGDVHPLGNPHYMLNPHNVLIVAQNIANKFSDLDPSNKSIYFKNLGDYTSHLKEKITEWESSAKIFKNKNLITYHKTFNYLADWLGINVIGYLEPKPGLPPTTSHLVELIQTIQAKQARLIVTESYHDSKPGRELASKTSIKAETWPTAVGASQEADTYEHLIDYLIKGLQENL